MSCTLPQLAYAHDGALSTPQLLRAWTWDPWLLGSLCAAAGLYVCGYLRLRARQARPWRRGRRQLLCFAAAWSWLVLALLSPLDFVSDWLFSAHMVQHELLMLVAAPLLVWARPLELYLWALPTTARARLLRTLAKPAVRTGLRWVTAPAIALLAHGFVRWMWHAPLLFEAALARPWLHAIQHASFFVTAVLFWWAVMQGRYGRLGYGVSVLFVFATAMHTGALGALITVAHRVWYPTYVQRASQLSMDALADQQLAGLIMWIVAGVVCSALGVALFAAWLLALQHKTRMQVLSRGQTDSRTRPTH